MHCGWLADANMMRDVREFSSSDLGRFLKAEMWSWGLLVGEMRGCYTSRPHHEGKAYRTRSPYLPGVDWGVCHFGGVGSCLCREKIRAASKSCCKQHAHPTPVSRYSMSTNARSASSSNAQASKVGLCVSSIESRGCHVQPLAVANERETNYGNTRRMLAQSQLVRFDARRKRLRLMHEWPRTGWRGRSG